MPNIFFHEQFAKTQEQWKVLAGSRNKLSKARGKGKTGIVNPDNYIQRQSRRLPFIPGY